MGGRKESNQSVSKRESSGITTIRCLSVLLILVPVAVFGYHLYVYDLVMKHFNACVENCRCIGQALEMYATDNNHSYPDKLELLVPKYIAAIPKCPAAKKDTYSNVYRVDNRVYAYTFCCQGKNHIYYPPITIKYVPFFRSLSNQEDRPWYNSYNGQSD
jgi:hypothetical protein